MPGNLNQTCVWRGVRLELPEDWEMLQFSSNPKQGRCAFADRYQYRLEFSWRTVSGPPDFERMLSDYRAKLKDEGMEGVAEARHGAWSGFRGETEGRFSSRFSYARIIFWTNGWRTTSRSVK